MADFNLKDDLLGFGRAQLKYMLFFNSTLDALTDYDHRQGLFYYDTDLDSIEFIKDNATGWNSIIHTISQNNPDYVANNDPTDRLLMGTKSFAQVKSYNPGFEGFVKIDEDGYPSNQELILFEDIEPTDYTTVITAPGLDTRFATEKAIVDYVATQAVTPQDNILDWNGTAYAPYPTLTQNGVFSRGTGYITTTDRLNYGGYLFANQFSISRTSNNWAYHDTGSISSSNNYRVFWLHSLADSIELYGYSNQSFSGFNYRTIPIHIGAYPTHSGVFTNSEYITIDDFNQLFNINMTTVRLNKGTANKYLYLDASKNITYVDAPSGGVTPVDNILDWDTNAYKPYTSKTTSAFYTGITEPTSKTTVLNFDGEFRASALYEGSSRVMTTHGAWAANGTLHAVVTSSHAGFCPQLPASATGLFLRDDGTWGSILWKRTGTTLSPFTSNDKVLVTTVVERSIYGVATGAGVGISGLAGNNGIGVQGEGTNSYGVMGVSSSGAGLFGTSTTGIAIEGMINPSSTNTMVEVLRLNRTSSGTASNNIGSYIAYRNKHVDGNLYESGRIANKITDVTVLTRTSNFEWWLSNSGTLSKTMELTGAGQLIVPNAKITGLATYADNTAATGGGLTAGQIYRTSTGELMVTY